jgi:hypothetical protein
VTGDPWREGAFGALVDLFWVIWKQIRDFLVRAEISANLDRGDFLPPWRAPADTEASMIRFPVFLARRTLRDPVGNVVSLSERRLIRQSPQDRVIAVVQAPRGTRVQSREDQNGPDQLVVPLSHSFLGRFFGGRVTIPAKYVIGDAYRRAYGLSLAEDPPEGPAP